MSRGRCRSCGDWKGITDSGERQGTVIPHSIRVDGENRACPGSWKYPTIVTPVLYLSELSGGAWTGVWCDRVTCKARTMRPGGRFCASHQREHGARLVGEFVAVLGGESVG